MVFNYMETIVEDAIDEICKSDDNYCEICKSKECISDVKAISLNNLKPFYVTSKKGEVYGEYFKKNIKNKSLVLVEVIKAFEIVKLTGHSK